MANRWLVKNFASVHLALVVLCIVSYAATIYLLTFWTYSRWPHLSAEDAFRVGHGELGGVLDYRWLGISVIYHVAQGNLETVFLFPDFTSYLLIGFIIFNLMAMFFDRDSYTTGRWISVRRQAVLSTAIAVFCLVAYVWTMMYVDSALRAMFSIIPRADGVVGYTSGVLQYRFPIDIWITNAFQGVQESSRFKITYDFTAWLLFLLLIQEWMLRRQKPNNG